MYIVKVTYKIQARIKLAVSIPDADLTETETEAWVCSRTKKFLERQHKRPKHGPHGNKTVYSNVQTTNPELIEDHMWSIAVEADVCQTCTVYAPSPDSAKEVAENQIKNAHRVRPNQVSLASDIKAETVTLVSPKS